jgi:AraC-like DNA-binding protein
LENGIDFIFEGRPADSPFIESIWRTQSIQSGTFMSQAASQWEMVVWHYEGRTNITVRGPETKATLADAPADAEFFGIQFKLGTFMPHLAARRLVNDAFTLPEATCSAFWLNSTVWQFPTFENADIFVNQLMRQGILVRDPVVEAVLAGDTRDISLRSVQRRFVQATGLTHKAIQQIERARRAVALLQQGVPILDTVAELGYFDQSHLTNALKRFSGATPAQLARISQPE